MHHFDVERDEAEDLFLETKRWLWLVATCEAEAETPSDAPRLYVTPALAMLDEMWHTFILCTRQYMTYCNSCFGTYIHHESPLRNHESESEARDRLRWQMGYVYDKLGADVLSKWYSEYLERYPVERVASLRIR